MLYIAPASSKVPQYRNFNLLQSYESGKNLVVWYSLKKKTDHPDPLTTE